MKKVSSSNGIEKYPKLRFQGFSDAWKEIEIGKTFQVTRGYVLPTSAVKECTDEAYIYPVYSSQTQDNGLMGYYNDFLYENAITWTTDGANAGTVHYRQGKFYCTNVCGVLLNEAGNANRCIAEILGSVSKKYVSYVGNPKLMNNVMAEIRIFVPSITEQKKIDEFLSVIDCRIAKQCELIEHLKKYKRGVIRKLFSQEIRFVSKDGSAFPAWTEYALEEVVEFLDGHRKPIESAERAIMKGEYPYYGASGIIDYISDYIFDEPLLLLGEDGANIITRSSPLCFIATGKYWVNNHAHVMRPKLGFDLQFVCEALESIDYTKYNTGTAQPKLNQEKCRQVKFNYPCYDEQLLISEFISELNKRIIDSEKQQCLLESQKKALLQQLFI